MPDLSMPTTHRLTRALAVGLVLCSSTTGLGIATGAPTLALAAGKPAPTPAVLSRGLAPVRLSATRPFFGVRLKERIADVHSVAWRQQDSGCGVRTLEPASPRTRDIHVTGSWQHPNVVRSISVSRPHTIGPHRTRLGERPATVTRRLGHRSLHAYYPDGPLLTYYWIKRVQGAFLWVRAAKGEPVYSFGLSASRADAVERATTLGGCY